MQSRKFPRTPRHTEGTVSIPRDAPAMHQSKLQTPNCSPLPPLHPRKRRPSPLAPPTVAHVSLQSSSFKPSSLRPTTLPPATAPHHAPYVRPAPPRHARISPELTIGQPRSATKSLQEMSKSPPRSRQSPARLTSQSKTPTSRMTAKKRAKTSTRMEACVMGCRTDSVSDMSSRRSLATSL